MVVFNLAARRGYNPRTLGSNPSVISISPAGSNLVVQAGIEPTASETPGLQSGGDTDFPI